MFRYFCLMLAALGLVNPGAEGTSMNASHAVCDDESATLFQTAVRHRDGEASHKQEAPEFAWGAPTFAIMEEIVFDGARSIPITDRGACTQGGVAHSVSVMLKDWPVTGTRPIFDMGAVQSTCDGEHFAIVVTHNYVRVWGSCRDPFFTDSFIPDGQWHRAVWTYAAGVTAFYWDGIAVPLDGAIPPFNIHCDTSPYAYYGHDMAGQYYFTGTSKELLVWNNTELTAADAADIASQAPAALASAVGDPHLVNLRGETFDLNMAGEHLLLQIPQGSGEELEVVGFVEHLPIQKSGQSPCEQFLFKTFTVRGNYVDAHKGEIVIDAGQNLALKGFGTTHQQNGTTTPTTYDSLLKRNAPTTVGKTQLWVCSDSNSKRQRSLCKQLGSMKSAGHRQLTVFTRKPSMFVMELHGAGSLPMHLSFSRFEGASPSYLNLALHGFGPSNEIGGLLGSDDHTEVSKIKANCIQTHHSKERPAARRHAEAHRNATLTK